MLLPWGVSCLWLWLSVRFGYCSQNRKEFKAELLQSIKPLPLQQKAAGPAQPAALPAASNAVTWPGQSAPAQPKPAPASAPAVLLQPANVAPAPSPSPSPLPAQPLQVGPGTSYTLDDP